MVLQSYLIANISVDSLVVITERSQQLSLNTFKKNAWSKKSPWLNKYQEIVLPISGSFTLNQSSLSDEVVGVIQSKSSKKHNLLHVNLYSNINKDSVELINVNSEEKGKIIWLNIENKINNYPYYCYLDKYGFLNLYKLSVVSQKKGLSVLQSNSFNFQLGKEEKLLAIEGADLRGAGIKQLVLISKDEISQMLYIRSFELKKNDEKLKIESIQLEKQSINDHHNLYTCMDVFNLGFDQLISVHRNSTEVSMYLVKNILKKHSTILKNYLKRVLKTKAPSRIVRLGVLKDNFKGEIKNITRLQNFKRKNWMLKTEGQTSQDIGIAYTKLKSVNDKKKSIEFFLRNNGESSFLRNSIRVQFWEDVKREDVHQLNTVKPSKNFIIKKKIAPFNEDDKNFYVLKFEFDKKTDSWTVLNLNSEFDENRHNNDIAIHHQSEAVKIYSSRHAENDYLLEVMSKSNDQYHQSLVRNLEQCWKRIGVKKYFHYERLEESNNANFIIESMSLNDQDFLIKPWTQVNGHLRQLLTDMSFFSDTSYYETIYPELYRESPFERYYAKNSDFSVHSNQVLIPSRIDELLMIRELEKPLKKNLKEEFTFVVKDSEDNKLKLKKLFLIFELENHHKVSLRQNKDGHYIFMRQDLPNIGMNNLLKTKIMLKLITEKNKQFFKPLQTKYYHGGLCLLERSLTNQNVDFEIKLSDVFKTNKNMVSVKSLNQKLEFSTTAKKGATYQFEQYDLEDRHWNTTYCFAEIVSDLSFPIDLNHSIGTSKHSYQNYRLIEQFQNKQNVFYFNQLYKEKCWNFFYTESHTFNYLSYHLDKTYFVYREKGGNEKILYSLNSNKLPIKKLLPSLNKPKHFYALLKSPFKGNLLVSIIFGDSKKYFLKPKIHYLKEGIKNTIIDLAVVSKNQKDFIVYTDKKSNDLVLLNESLQVLDVWKNENVFCRNLTAVPKREGRFLVLDRRENSKSWLYEFEVIENKLKRSHIWLKNIPVKLDSKNEEYGLACIRDSFMRDNLRIAISCLSNKKIIEYVLTEPEYTLKKIREYNLNQIGNSLGLREIHYKNEDGLQLFGIDEQSNVLKL